MRKRRTQAVVVIHGIGEQKPMGTVRSFVASVLPSAPAGPQYFSKPDPLSGTLELRTLQNRQQPRTHFFEYYWASQVDGTTLAHVAGWTKSLLLRKPSKIPPNLKTIWFLSWGLLVAGLAFWFQWFLRKAPDTGVASNIWIGFCLTTVWAIVQGFLVKSLGDAARYLSPIPENIKMRRTIRDEGLQLLRSLHDAKGPKGEPLYERIVVVGHSLGSVIAYDLLRQLWAEMHSTYSRPQPCEQSALAEAERLANALSEQLKRNPSTKDCRISLVQEYQNAQWELFQEMSKLGNAWRITDLITVGSPLTHAPLLLAKDSDDLIQRQVERELPTCPPIIDEEHGSLDRFSYQIWKPFGAPSDSFHLRAPHHGAPFGPTRWTNLYMPTWAGVAGDLVGGPLAPCFGPGVLDVAVRGPNWIRTHTLKAHSSYWSPGSSESGSNDEPRLSLDALRDALALDLDPAELSDTPPV
jgi:hypothetical protein